MHRLCTFPGGLWAKLCNCLWLGLKYDTGFWLGGGLLTAYTLLEREAGILGSDDDKFMLKTAEQKKNRKIEGRVPDGLKEQPR